MANNNPNQPREDDAVLGGHAPPLVDGVVLGGIEGVKMRLASAVLQQRVTALSEALKYGEAGLDLVIQRLQDESKRLQFAAYSLLKERQEPRVKQQLQNYLPWFEFDVLTVDAGGQEINRNRSQAQFFEEDLGNGVTLAMVAIPGGTFMMGVPETENLWSGHAKPQHPVTVAPFCMGKYPITQVQWETVAALPRVSSSLNPKPSRFEGKNRPVDSVSWYDAVEFCARVSKKTGRVYRLPSEAEWEYACRAGTTTPFHFGETITPELANCSNGINHLVGGKHSGTTPVGHFNVANAFGLYDMHGNVCEWCADLWHDSYKGAPTDGSIWLDSNAPVNRQMRDGAWVISPVDRQLRGGSWVISPELCSSAYRRFHYPGDRFYDSFGFRVVCATAWTS